MTETRERIGPLAEALLNPRYEVIPLPGVEEQVLEHLPTGSTVTVTSSLKKGMAATLELSERLSTAGYRVVPHLAARLVSDREHLSEVIHRLRDSEIDRLFVIAGDAEEPAGEFKGARDLLLAMSELDIAPGYHPADVGISGYPERHPILSDEATVRAMAEKTPYATHIVSQICFNPTLTRDWVYALRDRGIDLPLYIGVPGPVSNRKLLRVSGRIGLGESARFLKKHRNWLLRMFLPGGYRPDPLISALRPTVEDPRAGVRGFHIYTFNELRGLESWRRTLIKHLATEHPAT